MSKTAVLSKSGIKSCLAKSYVSVVKVKASKVAAYKKIFTKSICGRTVTVKSA